MQRKDVNKQIEFYCEKGTTLVCPFSHEKCKKITRSDLGICSFFHKNADQIICPNLFHRTPFLELISDKVLNTNNFEVYREVKIGSNFIDYILVDKNNYTNFLAVELQALDTSGNYRWVFGDKVKPFCVNWKTTKKTILSQLFSKVSLFKNAGKKVVLVIQDTFFDYLRFNKNNFDKSKDFHILTYRYENSQFSSPKFYSFVFDELIDVLVGNDSVDLNGMVLDLANRCS